MNPVPAIPAASSRRRFLIPEAIQTSGMDCGPAALKALLGGFRLPVSYGRLREACHTSVDGTSIDTLEEIARALGLGAEQIMIPPDHLLLRDSSALPAIVVARTVTGAAHFVVAWKAIGPWVQVMDPARGRLWLKRRALLDQLFSHAVTVPAATWRAFAGTNEFQMALRSRMRRAGISSRVADSQLAAAAADASWRGLASLDAAVRMLQHLRECGAISRFGAAAGLRGLIDSAGTAGTSIIPERFWSARQPEGSTEQGETVRVRGAVLVRAVTPQRSDPATAPAGHQDEATRSVPRSPELSAALAEAPARPLRLLLDAFRSWRVTGSVVVFGGIAIAALGVVFEALLLRSVLDISTLLQLPLQAVAGVAALVLFGVALLAIEGLLAFAERRAGSHLEGRLRIALLEKIPRLQDSYFQSRPIADMLERSHATHLLRTLPQLVVRFLRVVAEIIVTTAAIAWLDPRMATVAIVAAAAGAVIPLLGNLLLTERDLKVRTHAGALARFHLDALLGRTAIEAHGAEATLEREHEQLLAEWMKASIRLQRGSVAIEGTQMFVGFGLAAALLFGHFEGGLSGAMLLLAYWMLNLPALGYELALTAREYPAHRSTILRILEPLGAPEARDASDRPLETAAAATAGVRIDARRVSTAIAGHQILEQIDLQVSPGSHVAIVGPSGAGKSSLVGLLLGWQQPSHGQLLVDGKPLTAGRIDMLRRDTAWVDPTVQIWNESLVENLMYGSDSSAPSIADVLEAAALMSVIARLPDGMATRLGEGGALLSAGEAQRVRLARAMMRQGARLVILDEPFLGLERDRRRILLAQARQRWSGRTMLYVTHDVTETRGFDRVLVMDRGRIVEDGDPLQLSQMASSRYRRLLQAQEAVHARLTTGTEWRRVRVEAGRVVSEHGTAAFEQLA